MATTNRMAATVLTIGQAPSVALTPVSETLALQLTTVQVTTSQVRLLVKDANGMVRGSAVVNGTGVSRILFDKIEAQSLVAHVECLQGSAIVQVDEITGIEATSGAATIDADDIADGSLLTAKFGAGQVTPAKLGTFTAIKCLSAAGKNGKGAIAMAGTAVGDRLIAVFGIPTAGGALVGVANDAATFESTITVINEIQQTSAANLSANTYVFLLAPAAS